jgi:polyisoprenoid-binding protein YceI
VKAVLGAASLTTGNPDRDAHLKSADFFDVERFPTLTFESTAVRQTGTDSFELVGDLTIRGVTRPVTLRGEFSGPVASPFGDRRAGFSLTGEIDREAFGLTWNVAMETGDLLVSKTIKLAIEAEVAEQAERSTQAAAA